MHTRTSQRRRSCQEKCSFEPRGIGRPLLTLDWDQRFIRTNLEILRGAPRGVGQHRTGFEITQAPRFEAHSLVGIMDRGGATKRLVHEWRALQKQGTTDEHITILEPIDEGDLTAWRAILCPPASGVYGGGCFEIDIRVPDTYPIKPPTMRFRTRIFHPNVHWKVCICHGYHSIDRGNLFGCTTSPMVPSMDVA